MQAEDSLEENPSVPAQASQGGIELDNEPLEDDEQEADEEGDF